MAEFESLFCCIIIKWPFVFGHSYISIHLAWLKIMCHCHFYCIVHENICLHVELSSPVTTISVQASDNSGLEAVDGLSEASKKTTFVPGTRRCAFCSLPLSLKLNQYFQNNLSVVKLSYHEGFIWTEHGNVFCLQIVLHHLNMSKFHCNKQKRFILTLCPFMYMQLSFKWMSNLQSTHDCRSYYRHWWVWKCVETIV